MSAKPSLLNYAQPIVQAGGQATREFYLFLTNFFNATSAGQVLGTASKEDIGNTGPKVPLLDGTNEWSGGQTFDNGTLRLKGAISGTTTVEAAPSASGVVTVPAVTDQLVGQNTTDALTNKTLVSPILSGTVAGDNTIPPSIITKIAAGAVLGNPTTTIGNVQAISAGQLPATATNDDASAGNLGEYVTATVTTGAAITITSDTSVDVTSISLTPGNWLVYGNVGYNITTVTVTNVQAWTNTAPATPPVSPAGGGRTVLVGTTFGDGTLIPAGLRRLTLTAATTVSLTSFAHFTGAGSVGAHGCIEAWRPR